MDAKKRQNESAIVRIYNAENIVTAQMLRDLLKEEGIEAFAQNSGAQAAGHGTPGFGIYGVDLFTTEDQAEKALEIIKKYLND
ncbi:MAG: DUF2007 domain-containing protein [Lachnospiraceae bacterium]|nr:DUF2007 domain-containing protein [Lachnospiraceae bacterium]